MANLVTRSRKQRIPKCCQKDGSEVYTYWKSNFVFDVERAKRFAQDGRKPVRVARESVRRSVARSWICARHLQHVDVTRPGIIAEICVTTAEGEKVHAHLLIDGNHRAKRCLDLKRTFYAYVLSVKESKTILIEKPTTVFHSRTKSQPKRRRQAAK